MTSLFVEGREYLTDPELLLFDKDGTIIDIHHYWTSMIKIRAGLVSDKWFENSAGRDEVTDTLMDAMGVDLASWRMKPEGPVGVKSRPEIVNIAANVVRGHGVEITDSDMEEVFGQADDISAEDLLPLLKILPGVLEFLQSAKSNGIKLAIVSTDLVDRSKRALAALEIAHLFDAVFGGNSVKTTKPAPDMAQLAVKECGSQYAKTVVFGDHPVDMKMGLNAGVGGVVGVLTGIAHPQQFSEYGCPIVKDFTKLSLK